MNKIDFLDNRKGQSAIEYLMTYGWMLLVVAIVGGAIFATVNNQRQSCSGEVPAVLEAGQNEGFGVTDFAVTSGGAQAVVENSGTEEATGVQVYLGGVEASPTGGQTIGVGGSQTFTVSGATPSDSCTELELNVTYDQGGISGQALQGNITAQMNSP